MDDPTDLDEYNLQQIELKRDPARQQDQIIDQLLEIRKAMETGSWLLVAIAVLLGVMVWKLVI